MVIYGAQKWIIAMEEPAGEENADGGSEKCREMDDDCECGASGDRDYLLIYWDIKNIPKGEFFYGGPDATRTRDLLRDREAL